MRNSIKLELSEYLLGLIEDEVLTDSNVEDWHDLAFNRDYYVVYHSAAEEWLEQHKVSAFEAVGEVIEYELLVFGEVNLKPEDINPEKIVNLYVYGLGEELLNDIDANNVEDLKSKLIELSK